MLVEAGDLIPGDGEVIEGVASVDEAAITGEVGAGDPRERRRPLGRHRRHPRAVRLDLVRITASPGETFLDRMIALVEGAERQKTPNEIALNILLAGMTIDLPLRAVRHASRASPPMPAAPIPVIVLVALLVTPDPDHDRRAALGHRHRRHGPAGALNVLAMSGRAVEAAGDVDTLLLDKTGTITLGNRQATEFIADAGRRPSASWPTPRSWPRFADETPEGRSIVVLAKERYGMRGARDGAAARASSCPSPPRRA